MPDNKHDQLNHMQRLQVVYGPDFPSKIGRLGGKANKNHWFNDRALARRAGLKSVEVRRQNKIARLEEQRKARQQHNQLEEAPSE